MPTIPNGMKPVVEGYSVSGADGVARVLVGGGRARYGMEWDRGVQVFSLSLPLSREEFSVWSAFFVHVIKNGSLPFDMPMDSGFGSATHEVTIVPGSYSAQRDGGRMRVTFSAVAESAAYGLTEAEALDLVEAFEDAHGPLMRAIRPVVSDYSIGAPDGIAGGEIRGGMAQYARSWDRSSQYFQVSLVLEAATFRVWTAYFHHVAKKGAVSFDMLLDSGLGEQEHSVNIVPGSYTATREGDVWIVSFTVEAESGWYGVAAADATALVTLHDALGPQLGPLLERIGQFANVDTLVLQ